MTIRVSKVIDSAATLHTTVVVHNLESFFEGNGNLVHLVWGNYSSVVRDIYCIDYSSDRFISYFSERIDCGNLKDIEIRDYIKTTAYDILCVGNINFLKAMIELLEDCKEYLKRLEKNPQ